MTLDRKDYKSAIPQLEKRLSEVEKIGKDAFNKFEDIAHKTQLDAAEAEKKAIALDYKMTTTRVQMEYQLCTTGQTPVEANWQTTMPSITYNSYQGKTLWYRSKTYVNDIVVQTTEPMTVNLMDGVYSFVNTVSGNTGWTTIDGDKIQTGKITSTNNLCYFDLDGDNFQLKDASTLALSDNALAWDGSLGTLYIKGDLELAKDGLSYLKAYLDNTMPTVRVGPDNDANMLINPQGIFLRVVVNDAMTTLASFNQYGVYLGDYAKITPSGTDIQNSLSIKSGTTTKCEIDSTGISINSGDLEADGISFKNHRHALRGAMFDIGMGNIAGGIGVSASAGTNDYGSVTVTNASNMYPIGIVGWYLDGTNVSVFHLYNFYLSDRAAGSCKVNYGVRNTHASLSVSGTLYPRILWVNTDYGSGKSRMT